LEPEREVSTKN